MKKEEKTEIKKYLLGIKNRGFKISCEYYNTANNFENLKESYNFLGMCKLTQFAPKGIERFPSSVMVKNRDSTARLLGFDFDSATTV